MVQDWPVSTCFSGPASGTHGGAASFSSCPLHLCHLAPGPTPAPKTQFPMWPPRMRHSVPGSVHPVLCTPSWGRPWPGCSLDLSPEVGLPWGHTASQRLTPAAPSPSSSGRDRHPEDPPIISSLISSEGQPFSDPLPPSSSKEQVLLTHRVTCDCPEPGRGPQGSHFPS